MTKTILPRTNRPGLALVAATLGYTGAVVAQVTVPSTLDTDSYVFVGTNNAFSTELTVGVDLTEQGIYHFNFGVVEFADVGALDFTGQKYLRFEAEAYAITEIVDEFPVTTLTPNGSGELKLVVLQTPYSSYLATLDKASWYDTHIGQAPAFATTSIAGLGAFDINVTDAVNGWLSGAAANYGLALVLTSGDPVELGAKEGGNGAVLSDSPLVSPLSGDLDGDGDVDDADFGIAFAAFTGPDNGPPVNAAADLDGDSDVDDADFGLAFSQFTGPLASSAVPEPVSMTCFAVGGIVMLQRRRKRLAVACCGARGESSYGPAD